MLNRLLFRKCFIENLITMGKRNKSRQKTNHFAQKKRDNKEKEQNGGDRRSEPYTEIIRENESFVTYYKHQKICPDEEWDSFMAAIKANLPTTFRLTSSKGEAQALLGIMQKQFFTEYLKDINVSNEGEKVEKPKCLTWYPNELAWQLELSRKDIRRSEHLFKLHNFLIAETDSGNISRQEAVSMIPPLVLGVEPHHKVLDMCAAPGSKTAQLIEALHSDTDDKLPTGFVLANDIDNNRCYMLVHQAKRLNSPCFLVTNMDSCAFPSLKITNGEGVKEPVKFDRILCDVPCSGDGTMRKNPDIWLKWNLGQSSNLHGVQYRVARRGAELLAIGGRLVYSTCSLNPIENEAVLHRLLTETGDSLEIVDVAHLLPTLKYTKGMTYWEPCTKHLNFYKSFEEVPEIFHTIIRPQMFPPAPEDIHKYNLERCIRILPHLQNTGGFFVAVLEKKKKLPWESDNSVANPESTEPIEKKIQEAPRKKRRFNQGFKEDPFIFFEDKEEVFDSIKEFYQLGDDFNSKNLLTRCKTDKKKNIYFCSEIVRNLVITNEENVKIINTGVKTFVRCDNKNTKCAFRLAQEGLQSSNPFIGDQRRLTICKEDLITLLQCTDPTKPPVITELSEETRNKLMNLGAGSCVLKYVDENLSLSLVGWRGTQSLRPYIDQNDTIHMLRLLGADVSKYEKNKFDKKKENNEDNDEASKVEEGVDEKAQEMDEDTESASKDDSVKMEQQ